MKTAKSDKPAVTADQATPLEKSAASTVTTEREFRGGAVFQVPGVWEEKTPRSPDLIAGEYSVPGAAGPGRLTLSAASGGLEANLNRWKDQFQRDADSPEAKESTLSVDGRDATLVEAFGTFRDTFGGGQPQRNWALLGAVIPLKSTGGAYFVKLTGPRETLEASRDTFVQFVESAKFKE